MKGFIRFIRSRPEFSAFIALEIALVVALDVWMWGKEKPEIALLVVNLGGFAAAMWAFNRWPKYE